MPKTSSQTSDSKHRQNGEAQPSGSLTFIDVTPDLLERVRPFLHALEAGDMNREMLLELLRQPQAVKASAIDLYLTRLAFGFSAANDTEQRTTAPQLSEEQKERVNSLLLKLREDSSLSKSDRVNRVFKELQHGIAGLSIWQIRGHEARITRAENRKLSLGE